MNSNIISVLETLIEFWKLRTGEPPKEIVLGFYEWRELRSYATAQCKKQGAGMKYEALGVEIKRVTVPYYICVK